MALEATHIRFALDIAPALGVGDIDAYILGSIYPDSRSVTKIDRRVTHPLEISEITTKIDDFTKGWMTHVLCDRIQKKVRDDFFADVSELNSLEQGWIIQTAMKVVQDMEDMQRFDLQLYLPKSERSIAPNNEPIEKIIAYNDVVYSMYVGKKMLLLPDYATALDHLGISSLLIDRVIQTAERFLHDVETKTAIESMYDEMVVRAQKFI